MKKIAIMLATAVLFSGCFVMVMPEQQQKTSKPKSSKKGKDPSAFFIGLGAGVGPSYTYKEDTVCSVDGQSVTTIGDLTVNSAVINAKVGYVKYNKNLPFLAWRTYLSVDSGDGTTEIRRTTVTQFSTTTSTLEATQRFIVVAGNIDLMLQIPGDNGAGLGVFAGLGVGRVSYEDNYYYKESVSGTRVIPNFGVFVSGENHMLELGGKILPLQKPKTDNETLDKTIFYLGYTYKFF